MLQLNSYLYAVAQKNATFDSVGNPRKEMTHFKMCTFYS